MGRSPRCSKDGMNKGAWTSAEDKILTDYIKIRGEGKWSNVAKETGLKRCGKSCRLRWMNYLRPDIKRGNISPDEEELIIRLHKLLGNRWSLIAGRLPGRTDNEIKNYWNTNLAKKAQDHQLPVHANNEKNRLIKTKGIDEPKPITDTETANISSFPGTNVLVLPEECKGQGQINNFEAVLPQYVDGNWPIKNRTYETESSDGSPSSLSREENSSDFMMDFNMEDFCKMLDTDFTKFNDMHAINDGSNNLVEGDGGEINGYKSEDQRSNFHEKMEENWSTGSEGVQVEGHQNDMASEFLSLASSFLESAEEWPVDGLNVNPQVA